MKRILFFASLICNCLVAAFSQNTFDYVPDIPSPMAASFAKFGEVPVSEYTGVPDISIPLYTVQDGQAVIPITLRYHAGGIKVEEEASWVGLGWNLNVGGSITRIVVGKHDLAAYDTDTTALIHEDARMLVQTGNYNGRPVVLEHLFLYPEYVDKSTYPCLQERLDNEIASGGNLIQKTVELHEGSRIGKKTFISDINNGYYQPDLFSYSFMGKSGKFVKNHGTGQYMQINGSEPMKFERLEESSSDNKWKITDASGVEYYFTAEEYYRLPSYSYIETADRRNNTSYLTQVKYPNGEEVQFSYSPYSPAERTPVQTIPTKSDHFQEIDRQDQLRLSLRLQTYLGPESPFNRAPGYQPAYSFQYSTYVPRYLESITTKNYQVEFIRLQQENPSVEDREDLPGEDRLKEIVVTDAFGNQKSFEFSCTYFNDNFVGNDFEIRKNKRLKLDSIKEVGGEPYIFEYNQDITLPSKTSNARDYWGYYNGQDTNKTLLPSLKKLKRFQSTFPYNNINFKGYQDDGGLKDGVFTAFANRGPSSEHIQAGMLRKVIYPTKGYSEYQFEPHTFSNYIYESAHATNEIKRHIFNDMLLEAETESKLERSETFQVERDMPVTVHMHLGGGVMFQDGIYSPYPAQTKHQTFDRVSGSYVKLINLTTDIVEAELYIQIPTEPGEGIHYTKAEENITLKQGQDYAFEIYRPAMTETILEGDWMRILHSIEFRQYNKPPHTSGGGLRIKKINNYDANNDIVNSISYQYLDEDGFSSGKAMTRLKFFSKKRVSMWWGYPHMETLCPGTLLKVVSYWDPDGKHMYDKHFMLDDGPKKIFYWDPLTKDKPMISISYFSIGKEAIQSYHGYTLSAGSNLPIGNGAQGSYVGYSRVIKKHEGKNNGKVISTFHNMPSFALPGITVPDLKNGYKMKDEIYNESQLGPIKETTYDYTENKRSNYYGFYNDAVMNPRNTEALAAGYVIFPYKIPTSRYRLGHTTSKEWLDGSFIETRTDYTYNELGQQSSSISSSSNKSMIVSSLKYPHELSQPMVDAHVYSPVLLAETKKDGKLISSKSVDYAMVSSNGQTAFFPDFVTEYSKSALVATKIDYSFVDIDPSPSKSLYRVVEAFKENDVHTAIIWGYQGSLPIIKASNTTYAQLKTAVATAHSGYPDIEAFLLSFRGLDWEQKKTKIEAFTNSLKTTLGDKSPFTFYTYLPLCGIATQTDTNGKTVFYEYDNLERLKCIRDNDGNILERHSYNYQQ